MQATLSTTKLSAKTRKAIDQFGIEACLLAYRMNEIEGEGPTVISYNDGLGTIARANQAINAGREFVESNKKSN